jgi:general secretion pathway protein G
MMFRGTRETTSLLLIWLSGFSTEARHEPFRRVPGKPTAVYLGATVAIFQKNVNKIAGGACPNQVSEILKGQLSKMFSQVCRLLIVSLVIAAAVSCSACNSGYNESVMKAREAVLRDDLVQMRRAIRQYTADRGALPQSLDDLAKAGYLRELPEDPMTRKRDWKVATGEDPKLAKGERGIIDIRSSSTGKSLEGTPYNEW